ncbi:glycosyltransferase family 4 protein [Vibrio splendidus]
MKILWVVNLVLPKVAHLIGEKEIPFGGWVTNMIDQLSKNSSLEIGVVMRAPIQETISKEIEGVTYFLIPQNKNDKFDIYQKDCEETLNAFQPTLLHVEGSESAHARRFLRTWEGNNVVSMQGILKGYEQYEYGGLSLGRLFKSSSLKSTITMLTMMLNKRLNFKARLPIEVQTIEMAKNILGRTHWDRAHSYFINPSAPYYECSRILRKGFYTHEWDMGNIIRHRVFIGNSAQARKGAHFVLEAIALLKKEYPEIELVIVGEKPYPKSKFDWKSKIGYKSYLIEQIKELNLVENVKFLGVQNENEMINTICRSHVFIMSSIIENSPNTLGEAMILGVPCISSYMGGVSDMAEDGKEVLFYRDNDPVLLAMRIKQIFESDELATQLSINAKQRATVTHNPEKNYKDLLDVYSTIISTAKS